MTEINTFEHSFSGGLTIGKSSNSIESIRNSNNSIKEKIKSAANALGLEVSFSDHIQVTREIRTRNEKKYVQYKQKITAHFKKTHYLMDSKKLLENKANLNDESKFSKFRRSVIESVLGKERKEIERRGTAIGKRG